MELTKEELHPDGEEFSEPEDAEVNRVKEIKHKAKDAFWKKGGFLMSTFAHFLS